MGKALFDLSGQIALVTGARTGLGRGAALALAEAGADIAAIGSTPMPETVAAIQRLGRRCYAQIVDLAAPFDPASLVETIVGRLGPVGILVNNAGIIHRADFLDHSQAAWDAVMTVDLTAVFRLSQAVARHMVALKRPGRLINIASMLSFQGGIRVPAYTAAKHGLVGLTRAMANELAPHGITVNAIAPGYMATDNTEALRNDPARHAQILARIPMQRWGLPEDLATAIVFLAAPGSGYVTGVTLPVDGGWLVR